VRDQAALIDDPLVVCEPELAPLVPRKVLARPDAAGANWRSRMPGHSSEETE
jgi:hypothetical protein